nr:MAG: replication initiation protein [Microvirus sp.]
MGYRSKILSPNGKRAIVFNRHEGYTDQPQTIPCGQCRGCRLERSRQWAIRCIHEASMHEENCFITLTYKEEKLPEKWHDDEYIKGSLELEDFQKFMKRLRKKYAPRKIRFFHCGEYGEHFSRPHYHACLFGFDFPDKKLWTVKHGNRLFTSATLDDLWNNQGYSLIGDVTFESAAYVARYVLKKVNGDRQEEHYQGKKPEYVTMSRKPGIGHEYYKKYGYQIYGRDEVIINGKPCKPPKFYDSRYAEEEPELFKSVQIKREIAYEDSPDFDNYRRLAVKEKIAHLNSKKQERNYENEDIRNIR